MFLRVEPHTGTCPGTTGGQETAQEDRSYRNGELHDVASVVVGASGNACLPVCYSRARLKDLSLAPSKNNLFKRGCLAPRVD